MSSATQEEYAALPGTKAKALFRDRMASIKNFKSVTGPHVNCAKHSASTHSCEALSHVHSFTCEALSHVLAKHSPILRSTLPCSLLHLHTLLMNCCLQARWAYHVTFRTLSSLQVQIIHVFQCLGKLNFPLAAFTRLLPVPSTIKVLSTLHVWDHEF